MLTPRTRSQLEEAGAVLSEQVPLASMTTLRVGGPARWLAQCRSTRALLATVRALDEAGVPTLVLAGGSNLLVSDAGFDGVVVRVATDEVRIDGAEVDVDAGANWDATVARTVEAGLGGLECLSGIPGSTGATPVQNVGAYGVDVSDLLVSVQLLDRNTGRVDTVTPDRLGLGYRTSMLKHSDRALVVSARFRLREDGASAPIEYRELATTLGVGEGERVPAARARAAVLGLRRGKGMVLDEADHDTWSAGSFFTNPVVPQQQLPAVLQRIVDRIGDARVPQYPADEGVKLSAGWLIERAGFARGFPDEASPARLSTKHTLALTNRGDAKAADLVALARRVRDGVEDAFGVRLTPEPVTVGVSL